MMSKNERTSPGTTWLASILAALAIGAAGAYYFRPNLPPQSPPLIALDRMGHLVSVEGIEALLPGSGNRMQAIDGAMRLAQARVEAAGRTPEVIQSAKENAELVLRGSFAAIGWTVDIVWK
jgi:hypothetical protein